ncbi:MAG: hypothetical protein JWN15_4022 [Firmicutes bacterium]|nr:hypothetical protein [Bacillota bacterium]
MSHKSTREFRRLSTLEPPAMQKHLVTGEGEWPEGTVPVDFPGYVPCLPSIRRLPGAGLFVRHPGR